jgi:hypothetical protein
LKIIKKDWKISKVWKSRRRMKKIALRVADDEENETDFIRVVEVIKKILLR